MLLCYNFYKSGCARTGESVDYILTSKSMSKGTFETLLMKWRQTALSQLEQEGPEGRQELALCLQSGWSK